MRCQALMQVHTLEQPPTEAHPAVLQPQGGPHDPGALGDGRRARGALPLVPAQRGGQRGRRRGQPAGGRERLRELDAVLRVWTPGQSLWERTLAPVFQY